MEPNENPLAQLETSLRRLVENGLIIPAQQLIDKENAPYKIVNGKLVEKFSKAEAILNQFITVHPPLVDFKQQIPKLGKCDDEVLIRGETGTGKEIIARSLIGNREGKTRIINCGGMPEHLIESELFGHARGAFTGATVDKTGMMVAANGGLFILDEIGDLPLLAQAKLLRAIQEKKVRPVGKNEEVPIDCKIVCATNCDLSEMVEQKRFRQDLYARISTFEYVIPPIRERICDIEPIILSIDGGRNFLNEMQRRGRKLHELPVEHNVRSLRQHVRRFDVLQVLPP